MAAKRSMNPHHSSWIKRKKENIKTIENYKKFFFVEQLPFSSRNKLLEEITRLEMQNETIENMSTVERQSDDLSSVITIESILNKTPLKNVV